MVAFAKTHCVSHQSAAASLTVTLSAAAIMPCVLVVAFAQLVATAPAEVVQSPVRAGMRAAANVPVARSAADPDVATVARLAEVAKAAPEQTTAPVVGEQLRLFDPVTEETAPPPPEAAGNCGKAARARRWCEVRKPRRRPSRTPKTAADHFFLFVAMVSPQ